MQQQQKSHMNYRRRRNENFIITLWTEMETRRELCNFMWLCLESGARRRRQERRLGIQHHTHHITTTPSDTFQFLFLLLLWKLRMCSWQYATRNVGNVEHGFTLRRPPSPRVTARHNSHEMAKLPIKGLARPTINTLKWPASQRSPGPEFLTINR